MQQIFNPLILENLQECQIHHSLVVGLMSMYYRLANVYNVNAYLQLHYRLHILTTALQIAYLPNVHNLSVEDYWKDLPCAA